MIDPVTGVADRICCVTCPHHRVISDRDPEDWFNDDDQAVVCSITQNPSPNPDAKYPADRSVYRRVGGSLRPYEVKNVQQPDWCPLLAAKKN